MTMTAMVLQKIDSSEKEGDSKDEMLEAFIHVRAPAADAHKAV